MHFFCIFFSKNLHISKNFCTFAPDLKKKPIRELFYILTIIFNNNINN